MTTPDPDIHGPFPLSVLLGCSVENFQEVVGWNEQSSSTTVNLREDPRRNQQFTQIETGTPVYFEYPTEVGQTTPSDRDVHKFYGILQSWERITGSAGEAIRVTITDPREILSGVQLVLDGYVGGVGFMRNLLNVYGFHENQGLLNSYLFGNSQRNELGLEWTRIKSAVQILTSPFSLSSPYGTRILFKGVTYFVDLSLMPTMPDDYRIAGTSVDLLSVISQVCQDSGHDYIVKLLWIPELGNVIKIQTVSRRALPVLGTIQDFIDSLPAGSNASKSIGRELRNEDTNSVLVGGQVTALWTVPVGNVDNCGRFTEDPTGKNIWPYWGLYGNGNIIEGFGFDNDHYVDLPLPTTNQLTFNNPYYRLTVGEMRAALAGQEEWEVYTQYVAQKYNFDVDITIDKDALLTAIGNAVIAIGVAQPVAQMNILPEYNITQQISIELDVIYEQVREFASTYYGKQFLVRLPVCNTDPSCRDPQNPLVNPCTSALNTSVAYDPLTNDLITSWTPTDAGFLPERSVTELSVSTAGIASGNSPVQLITRNVSSLLGLSEWGVDFFRVEDGRIQCFVVFENVLNLELGDLSPDDFIVENGLLYVKAEVDPTVVFVDRARGLNPYVVVKLSNPITLKPNHYLNERFFMLSEIARVNGAQWPPTDDVDQQHSLAKGLLSGGGDTNIFGGAKEAQRPSIATIPLQSSNLTYGPWYWFGTVGKVRYDQDEGLTPWNYGSIDAMNAAGNRLVRERISNVNETELGYVEYAGIPLKNVGDEILANGPYIDSITMQQGVEGFTTRYTFRTFTPAFGLLAKTNADRIKRLGTQQAKNERYIRDLYKKASFGTKRTK